MGNVHAFNNDLPMPGRFDQFLKRVGLVRDLWSNGYAAEEGGLHAQRTWLNQYQTVAALLPSLSRDLGQLRRQATRAEIVEALVLLKDGIPAGGKGPTATGNRIMAERIGAREPSVGAINIAVLQMIDSLEWYPPPGKALAALDQATAILGSVTTYIEGIPRWHAWVTTALAESERRQALESQRHAARIAYLQSLTGPQ